LKLKKIIGIIGILVILLNFLSGCRKDRRIYQGADAQLSISSDTVYFDTVFTRLAGTNYPRSINKQFFIVNRNKQTVKTNIVLGGGPNSPFRINVDGVAANIFKDLEIPGEDSIIAFVEVTLDANNQINPALVLDSIIYTTNGNEQKTILAAYGWDAYYFKDSVLPNNTFWNETDKPYVIVNYALVANNNTLQIGPGVNVYSAPQSSLFVNGTLRINGSAEFPATFQGDRLQPGFSDIPGQWQGIHFLRESRNSEIVHADIKNALIGIRVDSLSNNSNPKLKISQSIIRTCSFFGLLGITSDIEAENVAIARCGSNGFVGFWGGNYILRHCTIASGFLGGRSQPAVALNNIERDENDRFVRSFPIGYRIENTIIFGTLDDEIVLDLHAGTTPDFAQIENCLVKTKLYANILNVNNNILNQNPLFVNPRQSDLNISSNSPASGKGKALIPEILVDLAGKSRPNPPAIGAYEP
jgi:hypothetical protein